MYKRGKAISNASHFAIDDVMDPADSRKWIAAALRSTPPPAPRGAKKHPSSIAGNRPCLLKAILGSAR